MGIEIERKFLVTGDAWRTSDPMEIVQGYLSRTVDATVRIRIVGNKAFLTVKGRSVSATRLEFEFPIPFADAHVMLDLCEGGLIRKYRHIQEYGGLPWETDEFLDHKLIVAEVELSSEDQYIDFPPWVGQEVTHDPKYYNSNL